VLILLAVQLEKLILATLIWKELYLRIGGHNHG
jgi:hypothetical protein